MSKLLRKRGKWEVPGLENSHGLNDSNRVFYFLRNHWTALFGFTVISTYVVIGSFPSAEFMKGSDLDRIGSVSF